MSILKRKFWPELRSAPLTPNHLQLLPQELIDQIVDNVALQCYQDGDSRLNDLKTCSLVSKSFYVRSRRRIFSQILFTIDKYGQRRAARLLAILNRQKPFADLLAHCPRTFSLTFDDSAMSEPFVLRMSYLGECFTRLQQRVTRTFTPNDHIYDLLNTLIQAPIVHFSLGGREIFGIYHYQDEHRIIDSTLWMIKNCSPKTLCFHELTFLPEAIVKKALWAPQLKELVFRRISYLPSVPGKYDNLEDLPIAPKLERLELHRVPYTRFLSILFPSTSENVAPRGIPIFHVSAIFIRSW